ITVGSCSDTSSCVNISTVDIIKSDFDNKLIIYPNPTNGYFYIDLGENQKNATITITNLLGKLILSKTYIDSQLLDIKLEEPTGVYILTVESGKKEAIIRLVIK
ncbi:MAG: T9SS type A sorting domain-containing protein, partial [Flavobacteriales bacterium]|nr:T9SS type A sorting domain-containing protein [Flavobacteriales bacterium]